MPTGAPTAGRCPSRRPWKRHAAAHACTPYTAGFLTAAAPNAGVVLRTALVLGAWGCGVFRNDPAQVAAAFRGLLGPGGRFAAAFSHVVFGVLDRTRDQAVRSAFAEAFADLTEGRAEGPLHGLADDPAGAPQLQP